MDSSDASQSTTYNSTNGENVCELIYHVLHVLLLRKHTATAEKKTLVKGAVLQPVIDILQYQVFCERIELELRKAVDALKAANIPSTLSFIAVGESGERLVTLLSEQGERSVGGEAVVRIDNW